MKICAISGSVRTGSYNTALLNAMAALSPDNIHITVYERLKEIPVFDADINGAAMPEAVADLQERIRQSDGVIISTPEYAHGVPGALKNALDWLVSSDALVLKPVVVTSVSTSGLGGVRAHSPLVMILSAMNANVVVEGSLNVPYAQRKFDAQYNLSDTLTQQAIAVSLAALEQAVNTP